MLIISGHAAIVGVIAAFSIWLATVTNMVVWLFFLSWVAYFLFDDRWQSAAWALLQMIIGVVLAIGLMQLTAVLSPTYGLLALVGLVFLFASSLVFLERLEPMNNLPAYYLGTVAMFATGRPPEWSQVLQLSVPIVAGFLFGWITVTSRQLFARLAADRSRSR